jgi:murein DD-endopeptidase MepM/ murein hydrolase activator NlpD
MKKIYYFSKDKLKFIEIENFKYKIVIAIAVVCVILFAGYSFVFSLANSHRNINSLRNENEILKDKLNEFAALYNNLDMELDSLIIINGDLRTAANLPPISDEIRMLGFGGGEFDNTLEFLNTPNSIEIKEAFALTEELTRKIYFEKTNYDEISKKLNENKQLYSAMPAVKPCSGTISYHGFGKRMHPILNRVRMHEGIDIVANVGTPVKAPGKGKIVFAGYKGSFGLTVVIDHGFGYKTLYAHLSKTLVKKGKVVERGDLIAKTGNTGLSTGPHLHYEVEHKGVKQDPMLFIFNDVNLFN